MKPEQAQVPQNDHTTPDSDIKCKTAHGDDNSTDNDGNSIQGKPTCDDLGVIDDGSSSDRNCNNHPRKASDFGTNDNSKFVYDPGGNRFDTKDDPTCVDDDNSPASSISNEPCTADAQCSDDRVRDKTIPSGSPFDANAVPPVPFTQDTSPVVTILNPHPNFALFSTILSCALGHSFSTRSLTHRSDRYQIT